MTNPNSDCPRSESELRQLVNRAFARYMAMIGRDTLSAEEQEAAAVRLIQDANHVIVWNTADERAAWELELSLADYHLKHTRTALRQLTEAAKRITGQYRFGPCGSFSASVQPLVDAVAIADGWMNQGVPPVDTAETAETRNDTTGTDVGAQADPQPKGDG